MSDMWSHVDWIKPVDVAIINLLATPKPLALTPANIAFNIEYQPNYVANRSRILESKGILHVEEDGTDPFFSITEFGQKIADREVSVKELEELGEEEEE